MPQPTGNNIRSYAFNHRIPSYSIEDFNRRYHDRDECQTSGSHRTGPFVSREGSVRYYRDPGSGRYRATPCYQASGDNEPIDLSEVPLVSVPVENPTPTEYTIWELLGMVWSRIFHRNTNCIPEAEIQEQIFPYQQERHSVDRVSEYCEDAMTAAEYAASIPFSILVLALETIFFFMLAFFIVKAIIDYYFPVC